jgi:hypothetical protein
MLCPQTNKGLKGPGFPAALRNRPPRPPPYRGSPVPLAPARDRLRLTHPITHSAPVLPRIFELRYVFPQILRKNVPDPSGRASQGASVACGDGEAI